MFGDKLRIKFIYFSYSDNGAIKAIIDKYADKLFANIQVFAVGHGLDPVPITGFNQKVGNFT